jgi:hypothetical protein
MFVSSVDRRSRGNMEKRMARLLIRTDSDGSGNPIQSIAIGFRNGLEDGIYEVVEVLDTLVIKRVGDSHLGKKVNYCTPNLLFDMNAILTEEEYYPKNP